MSEKYSSPIDSQLHAQGFQTNDTPPRTATQTPIKLWRRWFGMPVLVISTCIMLSLVVPTMFDSSQLAIVKASAAVPIRQKAHGLLTTSDADTSVIPASIAAQTALPPAAGVVTKPLVYVRSQPSPRARSAGDKTLQRNQQFTILGQFKNCSWLQIATDTGITGWIDTEGGRAVKLKTDCSALPLGIFRPFTDIIGERFRGNGDGELRMESGNSSDSVVILIAPDGYHKQVTYLRGGDSYHADGIADGIYELYVSSGSDWNGQEFEHNATYLKFVDPLVYNPPRGRYVTWEVTLQPVAGGNAETEPVDENEFPSMTFE